MGVPFPKEVFLKKFEDDEKSVEDNTWTSNSDLFMAIAVVFLIMFVFSLLTTGVKNTQAYLEKKADKQYRLGEIPESVKDQNKKDIQSLEKTIQTFQEKNKTIQDNVSQMQALSKIIQEQKVVFDRTKTDLLEKITMMEQANRKIKSQDRTIRELNTRGTELQNRISQEIAKSAALRSDLVQTKGALVEVKSDLSRSQKSKAELDKVLEKKEINFELLSKKQSQTEEQRKTLQSQLAQSRSEQSKAQQKVKTLSADLSKQNKSNKELKSSNAARQSKIDEANEKMNSLEANIKSLEKNLKKKLSKIESQSQTIDSQKNTIEKNEKSQSNLSQKIANMQSQLHQARSQNIQNTLEIKNLSTDIALKIKANNELSSKLEKAKKSSKASEAKNESLANKIGDLEERNQQLASRNNIQKGTIEGQKSEMARLNSDLKGREDKIGQLEGKLRGAQGKIGKLEASGRSKGDKIAGLEKKAGALEGKLADMGKALKGAKDRVGGLEGKLEGARGKIGKLEGEGKAKDDKIAGLEKKAGALEGNLADMGKALKGAKDKIGGLEGKLKKTGEANDRLKGQGQQKDIELKDLGKRLAQALKDKVNLTEAGDNKDKLLAQLKGDNAGKDEKIKGLLTDLNNARKKLNDLDDKIDDLIKDRDKVRADKDDLINKLADKEEALAKAEDDIEFLKNKEPSSNLAQVTCEKALANEKVKKQTCLDENKAQKDNIDELNMMLAAKAPVPIFPDSLKVPEKVTPEDIVGELMDGLKEAGIDVAANPKTGTLTLELDDSFYFANASHSLSKPARAKLSKIVPIYAQTLFGNGKKDLVSSIVVVGHASPQYNKTFADPKDTTSKAYHYNMDLSKKRAKTIVDFLFSPETGAFSYKNNMAELTKVSGKGYSEPILRSDGKEGVCGKYDCSRSRRVEISFFLKNLSEYDVKNLELLGH